MCLASCEPMRCFSDEAVAARALITSIGVHMNCSSDASMEPSHSKALLQAQQANSPSKANTAAKIQIIIREVGVPRG